MIAWNKGKKTGSLSEEHRRKISESMKGYQKTDEHKKNLSKAMKGKSTNPETQFKKRHDVPEEWRKKSSELMKQQWNDESSIFNSEEMKEKRSQSMSGENNPAWKGGTEGYYRRIARREMGTDKDNDFDKYSRNSGTDMCVHHIDGDITNNRRDNLQVLTRSEHTKLHHKQGDLR